MSRVKIWRAYEVQFLLDNLQKMNVDEIAAQLNRSTTSVKLYMFRHDIVTKQQVKRNLMRELVSLRIPAECFKPIRQFYESTRINQVQFYKIWHGYRQANVEELKAVSKYLNLAGDEILEFVKDTELDLFNK